MSDAGKEFKNLSVELSFREKEQVWQFYNFPSKGGGTIKKLASGRGNLVCSTV